MLDKIKTWFNSKTLLAHILATLLVILVILYTAVPSIQHLVKTVIAGLPTALEAIGGLAVALWGFYKTWDAPRASGAPGKG
jgi:predicted membrane-bound mannosyltransferase